MGTIGKTVVSSGEVCPTCGHHESKRDRMNGIFGMLSDYCAGKRIDEDGIFGPEERDCFCADEWHAMQLATA